MDIAEELEWTLDHDADTWRAYRNPIGATRIDVLVMDFITTNAVCKYLQFNCTQEVLTYADTQRTDDRRKDAGTTKRSGVSSLDVIDPKIDPDISDGNKESTEIWPKDQPGKE